MSSLLRSSYRVLNASKQFTFNQLARNRYKYSRIQSLQKTVTYRFCSSSNTSPNNTNNTSNNNNTELLNQLQIIQKQLNIVHKNSKKSRWRYIFAMLYFTPIAVVWTFIFLFWKNTKKELVEQNNASKVLNIVCSSIHSSSNLDFSSILSDNSNRSISFLKLKKCIQYACNDDNVLGISLIMDNGTDIGYASIQELRQELKRFKNKNKKNFILSYGKSVDVKEYLLSTICDEFYLMESAILNIFGFSFPQLFFKNLLSSCGIKPYVLKREKYKNFADMFTEDKMSSEHKESLSSLGNDLYLQFLNIIHLKTNKSMQEIRDIIDNAPYITNEAIEKGLITDHIQWNEYQLRLSQLGYKQIQDQDQDILFLSPKEYLRSYEFAMQRKNKKKKKKSFWKFFSSKNSEKGVIKLNKMNENKEIEIENEDDESEKEIALINISGEIRNGESEGRSCGSDTIEELIHSAANSDDVVAILLRIDSPGGDAIASESIWNAVYDAKTNGNKPIIVSMGDICASGGYYIASAADKIYGLPGTITGSIGVVMMSLSINELLTEKLNINYDQSIKFGDNSDILSNFEYPREKLQERYVTMIDNLYSIFMNRVSVGRNMSMDYVGDIAQGKVFTGQQALKIGLIDDLGGLREAKLACEELSGLSKQGKHAKLVKYCSKMERFMDILDGFTDNASTSTKYIKYNSYIVPILSQFNSFLKFKIWLNSFQNKLNDFETISKQPKAYYLCDPLI